MNHDKEKEALEDYLKAVNLLIINPYRSEQ
jgi:hypothetical protein